MTAAPAIKGWCPTLLSPMQSGDGWLARVKPSAATLRADDARVIAEGARRFGNGQIDLTSRANFQLRGLSPRDAERLAEMILAQGLASADASVEAVRNVLASPLGGDDPTAAFDSHEAARDIEAMLAAVPALRALPGKFGIAVDGGGALPLAGVRTDIMVRPLDGRVAVMLDGGGLAAMCMPARLAETIEVLSLAFLHLCWERREEPRRIRDLVAALGEAAIFEAAGLHPAPVQCRTAESRSAVGFHAYAGGEDGWFGVGLPFGRIDADALGGLAELAERRGAASLRATPWRVILIPGVAGASATALARDAVALGLIADAYDPSLYISACVGAPSCPSASVDARGAARRLAGLLAQFGGETLHVSGCIKSCAHRGTAALTLVGRDGRYDLIRDGTASDRPALSGLSLDDVIALLPRNEGMP